MPTLTSCPTCGRTQINLIKYANEIEDYLYKVDKNIHVAVMGCIVNGPGEASNADIGIAGGAGKAVLFKKGQIVKTIDENDIVSTLKEEIELM
jgi:(E)-4-hydroxy-3-methylbut-2-enyl-diphosphate synthase